MNSPARIQTSLQNRVPSAPMTREELNPLRERAWQEHGLICIAPEEILDLWTRQAIVNVATKLWGKRKSA